MRFEKVWVDQCRATKAIKRRFGAKSALEYLIGEKLISFAEAARDHPALARASEVPGCHQVMKLRSSIVFKKGT